MWVSQRFFYQVCLLFSYCIISFHFLCLFCPKELTINATKNKKNAIKAYFCNNFSVTWRVKPWTSNPCSLSKSSLQTNSQSKWRRPTLRRSGEKKSAVFVFVVVVVVVVVVCDHDHLPNCQWTNCLLIDFDDFWTNDDIAGVVVVFSTSGPRGSDHRKRK